MNRNMRRGGGGGPMANNQMRNLEHELEILQRRRDLLQYEQHRLVGGQGFGRKRQYENEQPPQNFPFAHHQAASQNFAHLYDDGPEHSFGHGGQQNKKRPINVWDNDSFQVNNFMNPMPQYNMNAPKPLMSIGRRISGLPPNGRNTTTNKVTKPKSQPYGSAMMNAISTMRRPPPPNQPLQDPKKSAMILRADQEPTPQMTGRLELALGTIVKEMKRKFCTTTDSTNLFNCKHVQRFIKNTIRERLKTIMVNKSVGKFAEIVVRYRKVYPPPTDKKVFDAASMNSDFDLFLKLNISDVMSKKLDEYFAKMKLLSEGKDAEVLKLFETAVLSNEEITEGNEKAVKKNSDIKLKYYRSFTDVLIEERLSTLLPNYTLQIIKMLDLGSEIQKIRPPPKVRTKKSVGRPLPTDKINNASGTEGVVEVPTTEANKVADSNNTEEENVTVEGESTKPVETVDDKTNIITMDTEKSSGEQPIPPQQYFAKVFGQPSLPNRADAYKFLNTFNAVSIKKHKVIQNLLVVEFNNENDLNNATAASGTVLGHSTLTIQANENRIINTGTPETKDEKIESDTSQEVLTPDLEHIITDFLTTFRKSETSVNEQNSPMKNENTSAEEKADNSEQPSNSDSVKTEETIKTENISILNDETSTVKAENEDTQGLQTIKEDENEDTQGLQTIKEAENEDTQGLQTIKEGENEEANTDGDENKTIKIKEDKGTPVKRPTRQITDTPRTLRTRSTSRK